MSVYYSKYGNTIKALDNCSTRDLRSGEWLFLKGPNGAGKSTLFKAITRTVNISSGSIELNGKNIHKLSNRELFQKIFLISQNPDTSTVGELTVEENLVFSSPRLSHTSIKNAIEYSQLSNHRHHLAKNLSGGQRQLLALQIARLRKTKLLLLDEPFAALDPANEKKGLELVEQLNMDGVTIFFITHDDDLIAKKQHSGSELFTILNGKII
ncbi:MAG: ABC transporter ATP-binding protein [Chitinophagaceae bacterium]|nr:ABC transporter ATP-binding protein [Chitinophagaceae bacterium]